MSKVFDKTYISVCCEAPIYSAGDEDDIDGKGLGGTYHYVCNQCGNPCEIKEKSELQKRYELLVRDFGQNGFTEQQSKFLINLLNDYIPII